MAVTARQGAQLRVGKGRQSSSSRRWWQVVTDTEAVLKATGSIITQKMNSLLQRPGQPHSEAVIRGLWVALLPHPPPPPPKTPPPAPCLVCCYSATDTTSLHPTLTPFLWSFYSA